MKFVANSFWGGSNRVAARAALASAFLLINPLVLSSAAVAREAVADHRFYARVGPAFMSFNIKASVHVGGVAVPGAGAHADPIATPALDVGYLVTRF